MTCSESPFLTVAPSRYSTNTMIDITSTAVATVHYIQNMPCCAAANYTKSVLVTRDKRPQSVIIVNKPNYAVLEKSYF